MTAFHSATSGNLYSRALMDCEIVCCPDYHQGSALGDKFADEARKNLNRSSV